MRVSISLRMISSDRADSAGSSSWINLASNSLRNGDGAVLAASRIVDVDR